MKKILVYGDSNVWGDNFITGMRIPDERQWVNIVGSHLKDKYVLFQEGLPGRLAGSNDFEKPYKNGKDTFVSTFKTVAPVDIVFIALGTNDLQIKYKKSASAIIEDLLWYQKTIEETYEDLENRKKYFVNEKMPKIIYILPINFDYKDKASAIFDEQSEIRRKEIIRYFTDNHIPSLSASDMPLFEDGIHLNIEGHKNMAILVEEEIQK